MKIKTLPVPKKLLRVIIFTLLLIWCFGFSYNSIFNNFSAALIFSPILSKFYSPFCHQFEEKSFNIFGQNLLVCTRCTGVYAGALALSFISIFWIKKKICWDLKLFFIALLPMLIDIFLYTINLYSYSKYIAFITGLFFGSVVFVYILALFENNFYQQE